MGHKWIIDVLADLQRYANDNELPLLAAELEQSAKVALAEIASGSEGKRGLTINDGDKVREFLPKTGTG